MQSIRISIINVSQALRYTAGVLPEVRPTSRYDSVFVRGFGGRGLTVLGNYQYEPQGGFYNFAPASGTVLPNRFGRESPGSTSSRPATS